jgi:hypothetical protein
MQPSQLIYLGNKVLDDTAHGCPRPCQKGNRCSYNGYCSFVHPGEQGMVRKFFPAHTIQKDGKEINVRARVILCASDIDGRKRPDYAPYYQRKEEQLSWPAWMKKQGIDVAPGPLPQRERPACIRLSYIVGQISDAKEFLYNSQEERLDVLEGLLEAKGSIEDLDTFYCETKPEKTSKKTQEVGAKGMAAGAGVETAAVPPAKVIWPAPTPVAPTPTIATPLTQNPATEATKISLSYASITAPKGVQTKESIHQTLLSTVRSVLEEAKEFMISPQFHWSDTLYVRVTEDLLQTLPLKHLLALIADTHPSGGQLIMRSVDNVFLQPPPKKLCVQSIAGALPWGDDLCKEDD